MKSLATLGLALTALVVSSDPADAQPLERRYVRVDLPQSIAPPAPGVAFAPPSRILYVNWCDGGCTITGGPEDSRANTSAIVDGTNQISEFTGSPSVRAEILACVREAYARFNIRVVDRDPGNVSHFETIAAGRPGEVGFPGGVAGVSPFSCGVIPNAISYNFLNLSPGDVRGNCWTIAQESAHSFGLSHEFDGRDFMTYNPNPSNKSFVDEELCVGTQGCCQPAQECQCGPTTQNSYRRILDVFGPANDAPPTLTIDKPRANESVEGGFPIAVTAVDAVGVGKVDILINGQPYTSLMSSPYTGTGPMELPVGRHQLTAVEIDATGAVAAITSISFAVGLGNLGDTCADGNTCASGACASKDGDQLCTEACDLAADTCPTNFSCLPNGAGAGLCWPLGPGCLGCSTDGDSPAMPILFGLVVGGLFLRRRGQDPRS